MSDMTEISELAQLAGLSVQPGTSTATHSSIAVDASRVLRGLKEPVTIIAFGGPECLVAANSEKYLAELITRSEHLADTSIAILLVPEGTICSSILSDYPAWITETLVRFKEGLARGKSTYLGDLIRQRVSPALLCPYASKHPVGQTMFFGRSSEVRDLCSADTNYIVVGPRRGGKTSLALRVWRELRLGTAYRHKIGRSSRERYLYAVSYVDVQSLANADDLWGAILKDMGLEQRDLIGGRRKKLGFVGREPIERSDYEILGNLLQYKYNLCTIILDEIDSLVHKDSQNAWPVLSQLRALVENPKGRAKVILVGYDRLFEASQSASFPFFGRFERIRLGSIERDAIRMLIEQPMGELGFTFDDLQQITGRIENATGGMPNLIQDLCCMALFDEQVRGARRLTVGDIVRLLDENGQKLVRGLYDAVNSIDDPLPRLVAYLGAPLREVRVLKMLDLLRREHGIRVDDRNLRAAFDYLFLHNVVTTFDRGNSCSFSSELLRRKLKEESEGEDGEVLIRSLVAAAREEYGVE